MKESEARKKTCPHHNSAMMVTLMMMATSNKRISDDLVDRQTQLAMCSGPECVMWDSWEWTDTNRELHNKGEGDCGLKPVCNGCHATCG